MLIANRLRTQSMLTGFTRSPALIQCQAMLFTGKTESGHKFQTPKMRLRVVHRVPAPGLKLKIPWDMTPEKFCQQIGGDCDEVADKFESMDQIFSETGRQLKQRDIPVHQRKYIMSKCYTL